VADVGGGRAGSAGFFDAAWCGNVVPRDSFYGLLAEHGERIVGDRDFVECYSERRGRPSIPPSTLARILLLAYRCGLSDRQAMEAVRFDLRWKVALGLPLDHEGFHPTSLVKFRARLLWRVPAPREGAPHAPHALGGRPGSAYLSRQSRLGRPRLNSSLRARFANAERRVSLRRRQFGAARAVEWVCDLTHQLAHHPRGGPTTTDSGVPASESTREPSSCVVYLRSSEARQTA
jgi:Transposase domain (DUF772)